MPTESDETGVFEFTDFAGYIEECREDPHAADPNKMVAALSVAERLLKEWGIDQTPDGTWVINPEAEWLKPMFERDERQMARIKELEHTLMEVDDA